MKTEAKRTRPRKEENAILERERGNLGCLKKADFSFPGQSENEREGASGPKIEKRVREGGEGGGPWGFLKTTRKLYKSWSSLV